MAYYKQEAGEKVYRQFSEGVESTLDADVELIPNVDYNRDEVYKFAGLGSMFNGTYRFRKIVHEITPSGYTVTASARMVYDASGNFVEDGYQPGENISKPKTKDKAPTKAKTDVTHTVKEGETLWSIAGKVTKNASDWSEIEKANHKTLVARDSRNANGQGKFIYPGMVIKIPGHLL